MMITRQFAPSAHRLGSPLISCWCAVTLVTATFATPDAASAQLRNRGYMGTFTYTMAQPTGATNDFIGEYSWLGFTLEGDWFHSNTLSSGFVIGWQEMYSERGYESFELNNGTATGRTYRHIGSLPMLVRGRYWLGQPESQLRPFVGAGIGTYWMKQTVDFGIYTADEDNWHFGFAPEVGVLMSTRGGVAWTLNARYNYPVKAGDYVNGEQSFAYWGIGVGVGMAR